MNKITSFLRRYIWWVVGAFVVLFCLKSCHSCTHSNAQEYIIEEWQMRYDSIECVNHDLYDSIAALNYEVEGLNERVKYERQIANNEKDANAHLRRINNNLSANRQ